VSVVYDIEFCLCYVTNEICSSNSNRPIELCLFIGILQIISKYDL